MSLWFSSDLYFFLFLCPKTDKKCVMSLCVVGEAQDGDDGVRGADVP